MKKTYLFSDNFHTDPISDTLVSYLTSLSDGLSRDMSIDDLLKLCERGETFDHGLRCADCLGAMVAARHYDRWIGATILIARQEF